MLVGRAEGTLCTFKCVLGDGAGSGGGGSCGFLAADERRLNGLGNQI